MYERECGDDSAKIQAARFSDSHESPDMRAGAAGRTTDGNKTPGRSSGAEYLATAKLLLMDEMDKVGRTVMRADLQPSSIPTIQGLLLLGQRECSCGNLSQGWQYTG